MVPMNHCSRASGSAECVCEAGEEELTRLRLASFLSARGGVPTTIDPIF
jgi:hypothetical protein